ncbi:MAG: hypothetical protein WCE63_07345 [Acidobacteriaceae bacterium]
MRRLPPAFDADFERKLISIGRISSFGCEEVREMEISAPTLPAETAAPGEGVAAAPEMAGPFMAVRTCILLQYCGSGGLA